MSNFSGLSTALSAIQAQKARLNIANQNIANANTDGYTRQRVELDSLGPATIASLHGEPRKIGDGVQINKITRMMDDLALKRLRGHEAGAGFNTTMNTVYNEIESRLAEPGDKGLSTVMGNFYAAWGDVANNPGTDAPRTALIEEANNVIQAIRTAHTDLELQWDNTQAQAVSMVDEINKAATGVAELNEEIRMATLLKHPASELQDDRDLLLNKLATLADVNVTYEADGQVTVTMDASPINLELVNGQTATAVTMNTVTDLAAAKTPTATVISVGGNPADVTNGKLGATLTALNTTLVDTSARYDGVASTLATQINAAQVAGFKKDGTTAGTNMFDGTTAATLALETGFTAADVAASDASGNPNNGENANKVLASMNSASGPIAEWRSVVSELGVEASGMQVRMRTQEIQRQDAEDRLASSTSVDIDEEVAMLVETQRAYQAAARMMTAVDEALDLIINRMGRVGL